MSTEIEGRLYISAEVLPADMVIDYINNALKETGLSIEFIVDSIAETQKE